MLPIGTAIPTLSYYCKDLSPAPADPPPVILNITCLLRESSSSCKSVNNKINHLFFTGLLLISFYLKEETQRASLNRT